MPLGQRRQQQHRQETTGALEVPRAHHPLTLRTKPSCHSSPLRSSAGNPRHFAASRICAPRPSAPAPRLPPRSHSHHRQPRCNITTFTSAPRWPLGRLSQQCIPHQNCRQTAPFHNRALRLGRMMAAGSAGPATSTVLRQLQVQHLGFPSF